MHSKYLVIPKKCNSVIYVLSSDPIPYGYDHLPKSRNADTDQLDPHPSEYGQDIKNPIKYWDFFFFLI